MKMLLKRHNVSSDQLDCEISERDITYLAQHFDNIELYPKVFELTAAEQSDVKLKQLLQGTQAAMTECLSLWRRHSPSRATLKTLLEILLGLNKEEIASNVCSYYHK